MIIMELKCKLMIGGLRARVVVLLHVSVCLCCKAICKNFTKAINKCW